MKKDELLQLWNKTIINKLNIPYGDPKPRLSLGEKVKIVTDEPDLCGWTWMDGIRKERKGKSGYIVDVDYLRQIKNFSPFSYRIRFSDNKEIVFVEEHLEN